MKHKAEKLIQLNQLFNVSDIKNIFMKAETNCVTL